MKRLILTKIDNEFDPRRDIPLGPWCFIGAEDVFPDWHKLKFIDALGSARAVREPDKASRKLTSWLIRQWAGKLNSRHGTDHSLTYWRFVLIAWILTSVQALWARYLHIQAFVSHYSHENLTVTLAPVAPPIRAQGFMEFQHILRRSPCFDYWLSSHIMRALAPKNWQLIDSDEHFWAASKDIDETPAHISNEHVSALGKLTRNLFGRLSFDSVPGTKYSKIFFSAYLGLLPKRGKGKTYFNFPDDLILKEFPNSFLRLLDTALDATMPTSYGDDYAILEAAAGKAKTYPGRLYIGNFMPSNEGRRLELAHALDDGEKFATVQHGAGYGVAQCSSWAAEFEYPHHSFLSWGWIKHGDHIGNFIPLPSPLLQQFINAHHETHQRLAMVATKIDLRDTRLMGPRPSDWLKYRNLKLSFISKLDPGPRKNLAYYSYLRGVSDISDGSFLKSKFKDLTIARGGLNSDMLGSRLLLLDQPGTTLHLALVGNVPTVCYWNPEVFLFTEEAAPFFKQLADCGILYDCPIKAAAHVNAIWNDTGGWWRQPNVQNARKDWAHQFARTEGIWWWSWLKTLTALQIRS